MKSFGILSVFIRFVIGKKWVSINEISLKRLFYKFVDVLFVKIVIDYKIIEKDRGIGYWKYKRYCFWIFINVIFFRIYIVILLYLVL